MSITLVQQLIQAKRERLEQWQTRYSPEEFPQKLVENLLYESLTLERMWPELKQTFNNSRGRKHNTSFDDAFNQVSTRRHQIQTGEILPRLQQAYSTSTKVLTVNFSGLREQIKSAQRGDAKIIEEITFSYFFYTFIYELIYAWSAAGLMGLSEADAISQVAGIQTSKAPDSLESIISMLGPVASLSYSSSI